MAAGEHIPDPPDTPPEDSAARAARYERARTVRRRRLIAAALVLLLLLSIVLTVLALAGGGSSGEKASPPVAAAARGDAPGGRPPGAGRTSTARQAGAPATPAATRRPAAPGSAATAASAARAAATAAAAAGSLPQTHALPSGSTERFRTLMAALWEGVRSGAVAPALPAFFPKDAYVQLKAVGGPGSDWSERLVRDYALDIAAAHRLLGAGASSARLLSVHVPAGFAHWVPPGVCYNSAGYYELPNARVVYSEGGRVSSFGIASMISWRGVWYVVHLGAILREGAGGVVDEPASGGGTSAYSGTC